MEEITTLPGFGGVGKVVAALSHWLNGICVTSRVSLPRRYTLGNERGQFYLLDKMDCMAPTGRTRAHGLAGEPRLVGWLYQSPNILSHVNSILHVDPGDGGAPLGPLAGHETRSVENGGPPGAAFQPPASDVGFAVAVEVADVDIYPGDPSAPLSPLACSEHRAVGHAGPPGAAFQPAAGDVRFAVAAKIADLHVDPGSAGTPRGPQAIGERAAGGL